MKDGPNIARLASIIGEPARAEALTALMGGRAMTASELAATADVTKQTMSAHLAKLLDASLVAVDAQGRHRYFRLAGEDIARLLESLMGVAFRTGATRMVSSPREPALRQARLCYDHLAGDLGVAVYEALLREGVLELRSNMPELTAAGAEWLSDLGIDAAALARQKRAFCRTCMDWSVRRHHLAGALGAALLARFCELSWIQRRHGSRVVRLTPKGRRALRKLIGAALFSIG